MAIMPIEDFVFVRRTDRNAGDENFPHAGIAAHTHRVTTTIPRIEIADHADAFDRWGPDGKQCACDIIDASRV